MTIDRDSLNEMGLTEYLLELHTRRLQCGHVTVDRKSFGRGHFYICRDCKSIDDQAQLQASFIEDIDK